MKPRQLWDVEAEVHRDQPGPRLLDPVVALDVWVVRVQQMPEPVLGALHDRVHQSPSSSSSSDLSEMLTMRGAPSSPVTRSAYRFALIAWANTSRGVPSSSNASSSIRSRWGTTSL